MGDVDCSEMTDLHQALVMVKTGIWEIDKWVGDV